MRRRLSPAAFFISSLPRLYGPPVKKLLLLPVLIAFACLLAGAYGVLHNQISYTVAPAYFHEFKFRQFGIDPAVQGRIGAGIVGFLASWWMGLVIGLPVYLGAVCVKGTRAFVAVYIKAAALVIAITLLVGLAALAHSFVTLGPDRLPAWMEGREISTPVAFARAGAMHNANYLGGVIGLGGAWIYTLWRAYAGRRATAG